MMSSREIIDGPHNVRPKAAGEYFVAAGGLIPAWYPATFERSPVDALIIVDIMGIAVMRHSLGPVEHR